MSYGLPEIMETIITNVSGGEVGQKEGQVSPGKWAMAGGGEVFAYN